MDGSVHITVWAVLAFVCWLIVAGGAALAILSRSVKDTMLERIGLASISLTATGAGCRILLAGWASAGDAALAVSAAFYVACVTTKLIRNPQHGS